MNFAKFYVVEYQTHMMRSPMLEAVFGIQGMYYNRIYAQMAADRILATIPGVMWAKVKYVGRFKRRKF